MAKLNKQEINAIACKLHGELTKYSEEAYSQAVIHYVPSENYEKIMKIVQQRDMISEQINKLKKEKDQIIDDLEDILREHYNIWWKSECSSEKELHIYIVKKECKMKQVPSIEDLKNDVTIAAIDSEFNTSSFIEEQLSKFK